MSRRLVSQTPSHIVDQSLSVSCFCVSLRLFEIALQEPSKGDVRALLLCLGSMGALGHGAQKPMGAMLMRMVTFSVSTGLQISPRPPWQGCFRHFQALGVIQ